MKPDDMLNLFDLTDILVAGYWYCADYHNGQSSELYRLLCSIDYSPGAMESSPGDDAAAMVYRELEAMPETDAITTISLANTLYEREN